MSDREALLKDNFANELLGGIKRKHQDGQVRSHKRRFNVRLPIVIYRDLAKAAGKHGISMTDVVIEALRRVLPGLLRTEERYAIMRDPITPELLDKVRQNPEYMKYLYENRHELRMVAPPDPGYRGIVYADLIAELEARNWN